MRCVYMYVLCVDIMCVFVFICVHVCMWLLRRFYMRCIYMYVFLCLYYVCFFFLCLYYVCFVFIHVCVFFVFMSSVFLCLYTSGRFLCIYITCVFVFILRCIRGLMFVSISDMRGISVRCVCMYVCMYVCFCVYTKMHEGCCVSVLKALV